MVTLSSFCFVFFVVAAVDVVQYRFTRVFIQLLTNFFHLEMT